MTEQQAAYLAGAIAHANVSLDWIEARRDGPLPDDGYARIETSVGVVRALAGRETTVATEQHKAMIEHRATYTVLDGAVTKVSETDTPVCGTCWRFVQREDEHETTEYVRAEWPCEVARLRERVAALEAALQDASDHLAECAAVLKRANRDWSAAGALERVRQLRAALAGQPAAGGA